MVLSSLAGQEAEGTAAGMFELSMGHSVRLTRRAKSKNE